MSYLEECSLRGAFYSPLPDTSKALAQCLHTGLLPDSPDTPVTFLDATALRDQIFEPIPVSGSTELNQKQSLLVPQFCLEPVPEPGRENRCQRFIFTTRARSLWNGFCDEFNHFELQLTSRPTVNFNELAGVRIITEPTPGVYDIKHYRVFETFRGL